MEESKAGAKTNWKESEGNRPDGVYSRVGTVTFVKRGIPTCLPTYRNKNLQVRTFANTLFAQECREDIFDVNKLRMKSVMQTTTVACGVMLV